VIEEIALLRVRGYGVRHIGIMRVASLPVKKPSVQSFPLTSGWRKGPTSLLWNRVAIPER